MDANVIQKIRDSLARTSSHDVVLTRFEAQALVNHYDLFSKFNSEFDQAFPLSGSPK